MKKKILSLIAVVIVCQTYLLSMEKSNNNPIEIIVEPLRPPIEIISETLQLPKNIKTESTIKCFGAIIKKDNGTISVEATEGNVIVDSIVFSNNYIHIKAGKEFKGHGVLCADKILIDAKKISFDGTIICNKLCIIESKEKVDPKNFWIIGKGIFSINGKNHQSEDMLKDEVAINENTLLSIFNIRKKDLKNRDNQTDNYISDKQ